MVFPVVMYGFESWSVKKAKCQRTNTFALWCWRRLLRVPWTARSNQSVSREISLECLLEGLMLKLKLQYFDHLMWCHLIGKVPDAGKDWGQKEKRVSEGEMAGWHHWCSGHELGQTPGDGEGQGPGVLQSMGSQRVRQDRAAVTHLHLDQRYLISEVWGWPDSRGLMLLFRLLSRALCGLTVTQVIYFVEIPISFLMDLLVSCLIFILQLLYSVYFFTDSKT